MHARSASRALCFALLIAVPVLSACQTTEKIDTTTTGTSTSCDDKKNGCLKQNLSEVQQMIGDPENSWVENPEPYISPSGNRMIAYMGTVSRLSCSQLHVGQTETDEALVLLEPKDGESLGKERRNLLAVATQASQMIATELQNRCWKGITRA